MAHSNLAGLTSRRPFTLLGIVLALLVIAAFVLVAINASAGQGTTMQNVVVAGRDLQPRIPIDASALEVKSIAVGGYPTALLYHSIQDVVGMIPLVTILSGEPVTTNVVTKSEFLPIPTGYVALTVPTSEQQGVAGYIQPNDYISVIATVDINGKVAAKTIFTNLHVIRVGPLQAPSSTQGGATIATSSSLTVVVTECQAEFITWFLTYASLKYSLESYQDYLQGAQDPKCAGYDPSKGVTLQTVQTAFPSLFS